MSASFDAALAFTLMPSNDGQPYHVDSGGPTSYGVTQSVWSAWIGRPATASDMKQITAKSVSNLYYALYYLAINGDSLPGWCALMCFDQAVLAGPHNAAVQLQQAIGLHGADVDGNIGARTAAALASLNPKTALSLIEARQEFFLRSCKTFPVNGKGWLARLDRRKAAALALIPTT